MIATFGSNIIGPNSREILAGNYEPPEISSSAEIPKLNFLHIRMELCDMSLDKYIAARINPDICKEATLVTTAITQMMEQPSHIFAQLCCGLSAIHDAQIIHRDLQPGNIFVRGDIWKIGDFGLSRTEVESSKSAQRGTPLYQSPEMYTGSKHYGFETDVYSLGLIFLLILNKSMQKERFYRVGIFTDLRDGNTAEVGKALVEAGKDVPPEFSVELSTTFEMVARTPSERITLPKAISEFNDPKNLNELTSRLKIWWPGRARDNCQTFRLPDHTQHNFIARTEEHQIVERLRKQEENKLSLILVEGSPVTGKTTLLKNIVHNLQRFSRIWLDCDFLVGDYAAFCNGIEEPFRHPWIIVFDGLEKKGLGCFKIILNAIQNLDQPFLPRAVIVSTSYLHLDEDLIGSISVEKVSSRKFTLDYNAWLWELIAAEHVELLPRLILRVIGVSHGDVVSSEEITRVQMVCESFNLLSRAVMVEYKLSDKLRLSLSFMILMAYATEPSPVDSFLKSEFFDLWAAFLDTRADLLDRNLSWMEDIFNCFQKTGVLINTSHQMEQGEGIRESCGSLCGPLFMQALTHPVIRYLLHSLLQIEKVDPLNFGVFRKLLFSFKRFVHPINKKLDNLTSKLKRKWVKNMWPFASALISDYPNELALFSTNLHDLDEQEAAYGLFRDKFGELHSGTLALSSELARSYCKYNENEQALLEMRERQLKEFSLHSEGLILEQCNLLADSVARQKTGDSRYNRNSMIWPSIYAISNKLLTEVGALLERLGHFKEAWKVYFTLNQDHGVNKDESVKEFAAAKLDKLKNYEAEPPSFFKIHKHELL